MRLKAFSSDSDPRTKRTPYAVHFGTGSPESAVTANPGDLYVRQDGPNGSLWAKALGTGNTGWVNLAASSLSAFGSSANANGLTLTGSVLNLEPASASFPGGVSTGTQTFAGNKTFSGTVQVPAGSVSASGIQISAADIGFYFNAGQLISTVSGVNCGRFQSGQYRAETGTSANPSISFSAFPTCGLYGISTSRVGVAALATEIATFDYYSSTQRGINLNTPSAGNFIIYSDRTNAEIRLRGGNASTDGGGVSMYGSAHASKANFLEFIQGANIRGHFDASGHLNIANNLVVTGSGTFNQVLSLDVGANLTPGNVSTTGNIAALAIATSMIRLTGGSLKTIQGIAAGSGGRIIVLHNTSSTMAINHEDAAATSANRINTPDGLSLLLPTHGTAIIQYDNTTARWRILSSNPASSTTSNFTIANNQVSAANVTGLSFDSGSVKAARVLFDLQRATSTEEEFATGELFVRYNGTTWQLEQFSAIGDGAVVFTITAAGQVQYASSNMSGASYSGTLRLAEITSLSA